MRMADMVNVCQDLLKEAVYIKARFGDYGVQAQARKHLEKSESLF